MKKKEIALVIIILLVGVFFRFWHIAEIPVGLYPDEAMNGSNALEALATNHFKVFYPENNGREGLFINIQAISIYIFGNFPWALRSVSAVFGSLTVLAVYLLGKELFREEEIQRRGKILSPSRWIPPLSAFFLATSYWHVNFSRIGFRAISVPFFATFGLYFLLKGLRRGTISDLVFGGIFIGLGFHTYIAFRFMPFVIAIPLGIELWRWYKNKNKESGASDKKLRHCVPCAVALFLFVIFIVALPIGYYFLKNPGDFVGRSGQVSIFSAKSPAYEFLKSNVLTLGMFFVHGDCNWRHNYNCNPELNPLLGIFFAIGIGAALMSFQKKESHLFRLTKKTSVLLLFWAVIMSLPSTLTREGLPHALRSIGIVPPVMLLSGLGGYKLIEYMHDWFEKQKDRFPTVKKQIVRIQKELIFFFLAALLIIPLSTYIIYFQRWAQNPNTYFSFATDSLHLGQYLNSLDPSVKKIVVVNTGDDLVRGIPMPAQTVMFITDTFRDEKRTKKNIEYNTKETAATLNYYKNLSQKGKTVIAFINGKDKELINKIKLVNPGIKASAPKDFVTLEN